METKDDRPMLTIRISDYEMTDQGMKIIIGGVVVLLVFSKAAASTGKLNNTVPFRDLILKYSNLHSLDPCLVAAVIKKESDFDPNAVNPNDPSYGLGQITLPTAGQFRDGVTKAMLFIPDINIEIMCQFINWLRAGGAPLPAAISAYNTGLSGWKLGHIPNPPNYSEIVIGFMKGLCNGNV